MFVYNLMLPFHKIWDITISFPPYSKIAAKMAFIKVFSVFFAKKNISGLKKHLLRGIISAEQL